MVICYHAWLSNGASQISCPRAHLDRRPIHRGEILPAIAELHLATRLDRKLFERANVLNQKIHEPQLVDEADEDVQAGRVEGDWRVGGGIGIDVWMRKMKRVISVETQAFHTFPL